MRVTFSDIKMPTGTTNPVFDVDLLSTNQYYPYGMVIEDLSWNTGDIRYGFGGTHEMDNEVKGGVGNHLSFGDFGYDTRVARRFNLDPITQEWQSDYSVFANNPISISDPTGYDETPCDNCPDVNPKAGGGKDLGNNILNGAKNSLIVLGGIVNSIVSNSFTFSDKNIVNLDNFKVSDETKHYFKVGEEEGHKLTITIAAFETAVGIYEEATGTFLLPFTEGASGLVIAKGYLLNAHGVFASTNAIIKLQNMNSVGNTSGGGVPQNKDVPEFLKKQGKYKEGKLEGRKGWFDKNGNFISKGDKAGEWHVQPKNNNGKAKWPDRNGNLQSPKKKNKNYYWNVGNDGKITH